VAAHLKNGALEPSVCMSFARIPSPDADLLIADAVAVFGDAQAPPGGSNEPVDPNAPLDPTPEPAMPATTTDDPMRVAVALVGLAVAVAAALFGALSWLVRRRRAAT
jgi:hypothetical protein